MIVTGKRKSEIKTQIKNKQLITCVAADSGLRSELVLIGESCHWSDLQNKVHSQSWLRQGPSDG